MIRVVALPGGISLAAALLALLLPAVWAAPLWCISLFFAVDCALRLRDLKRLRAVARIFRVIHPIAGTRYLQHVARRNRTSFCHRQVTVAVWPAAQRYYHARGYRWYHILPDGFPSVMLKLAWWRSFLLGG